MVVTYDLYKELDLNRSWDESQIKTRLKEIQRLWTKRQSACNDKAQLLLIDDILSKTGEGFRILIKKERRKEYDVALDLAYKTGTIKDKAEAELQNLIDKARNYYRQGKLKLAAQCAYEAIVGKVNNPKAYEILANCQYDAKQYQKALNTVDAGIKVFKDNIDLMWMGIRYAIDGKKDYNDAQARIDKLVEIAPNNSLAYSEQIYLHLKEGQDNLAFKEMDAYIQSFPDDVGFRKEVAYNIEVISNDYYYYDQADNATFIADKESYNKCLKWRRKAVEIYCDEHTKDRLVDAEYYGQRKWDSWNIESIKCLSIYGIIFLLLSPLLGAIFLAIDAVVIFYSFRPYWQINKTYVTGQRGVLEQIVSVIGELTVKLGGTLLKFCWWFVKSIFKLSWAMATGQFFR